MYILYETTNNVNNKIYIGVHKTESPDIFDGYYGSGIAIKNAIKKHGKENFTRKTLYIFDDKVQAYKKEMEIVSDSFIKLNNYNMRIGGCGGSNNPSEETKQKIRDTIILNGTSSGSKNPMYGKKGSDHPKHNKGKIIQQYDRNHILIREEFLSYFMDSDFSQSMICKCCKMVHKTHKGFIFKYKEDASFVFPTINGNIGVSKKYQ